MYLIIVGGGRTGSTVLEQAIRDEHEVVVIEKEPAVAEEISASYDCLVINASAASREILDEAGITEADTLITTTNDDSINLMVMMLGRQFEVDQLVSSVADPEHSEMFHELGVDVVQSPQSFIGKYLYHAVQLPGIHDYMDIGDGGEIVELKVEERAPIANRSLQDASDAELIPEETIFVAVRRDGELKIPNGTTEIAPGDFVTLLSLEGATNDLVATFTERTD